MNFKVEWTGAYPCLCFGEWKIEYKGIELVVPEKVRESHMDTLGEYSEWCFTDDWDEEWSRYTDGKSVGEWLITNEEWIREMFQNANIEYTEELAEELFYEIQAEDFRPGSCGGCI